MSPERQGPPSDPLRGEDRLVEWLASRPQSGGLVGDDAAFLTGRGPWAVTVDSQRAGVHHPSGLAEKVAAERLLAVNLSDLAAVGARPRYAFLALGVDDEADPRRYLTALLRALRRHEVVLAGGDTSRAPVLEATLTLIGERPPRGRFLHRDAARPGDRLWLGGSVGESAAGRLLLERGARLEGRSVRLPGDLPQRLEAAAKRAVRRHLSPRPQLDLGYHLGRRRGAVAAIDLSDGLARDLHRLARASRVGASIDATAIPVAARFGALAAWLGRDPLDLALGGGEDYVLLFSLPRPARGPEGCHCIGELTPSSRLEIRGESGAVPLRATGWDHLA